MKARELISLFGIQWVSIEIDRCELADYRISRVIVLILEMVVDVRHIHVGTSRRLLVAIDNRRFVAAEAIFVDHVGMNHEDDAVP